MNDVAPLSPDHIDELLSAELDGEFDAAAHDLGLDPADARARLEAAQGVGERRLALTGARDALAAVPALDEITAARLRTGALEAASERKPRRLWALAGSIAAALVLVAGVLVAVSHSSGTGRVNANASAPVAGGASVPTSIVTSGINFGAVNSVDQLASTYQTLSHTQASTHQPYGAPSTNSNADFVPASAGDQHFDTSRALSAKRAATGTCDAAAVAGAGVSGAPIERGFATVAGTPVVVLIFGDGPRPVMVVLSSDCRVRNRVVLPPKG